MRLRHALALAAFALLVLAAWRAASLGAALELEQARNAALQDRLAAQKRETLLALANLESLRRANGKLSELAGATERRLAQAARLARERRALLAQVRSARPDSGRNPKSAEEHHEALRTAVILRLNRPLPGV